MCPFLHSALGCHLTLTCVILCKLSQPLFGHMCIDPVDSGHFVSLVSSVSSELQSFPPPSGSGGVRCFVLGGV